MQTNRAKWVAEGLSSAEAAGGVLLEKYFQPGFTGGASVRVLRSDTGSYSGVDEGFTEPDEGTVWNK